MSSESLPQLSDLTILLGEPAGSRGDGVQAVLESGGKNVLLAADSEKAIRARLQALTPDVAILDVNLDGDVLSLVREVRWGRLGANPFLPIILTTYNTKAANISLMIGSGADEILVKPVPAVQVMERLRAQAFQRKPYVAVGDYIGPDRRGDRAGAAGAGGASVFPPNAVRARIDGREAMDSEFCAAVAASQLALAEQRFQRDVSRIEGLVQLVRAAAADPLGGSGIGSDVAQIAAIAGQLIGRRLADSQSTAPTAFSDLEKAALQVKAGLPDVDQRAVARLEAASKAALKYLADPEVHAKMVSAQALVAGYRASPTVWH